MEDEEVLGAVCGGGALDAGDGAHHNGHVLALGLGFLPLGEIPAQEGEDKRDDGGKKAQPALPGSASQQEQQHQTHGGGKEEHAQPGPGVRGQEVTERVAPLFEENLRHLVNLVLRLCPGKLQIIAHIGIGRVQPQGAFVPKDGRGYLSRLEVGVAQIVIQFAGHQARGANVFPVLQGLGIVAVGIGLDTGVPQGVRIGGLRLRGKRQANQ